MSARELRSRPQLAISLARVVVPQAERSSEHVMALPMVTRIVPQRDRPLERHERLFAAAAGGR